MFKLNSVGAAARAPFVARPFHPALTRNRLVRHVPAWLASACCLSAMAQTAPSNATATADEALPEVRVTASPERSGPRPDAIVDADRLRERGAANLGDALAGEPGVQASHFGAGASRPIVRGLDGARVPLLSDGAPIEDASAMSPDHAVTAEPMLAERVELISGPAALLQAPGAMGGVINVVDRRLPQSAPVNGLEGEIGLRANSGAREKAGAFWLTGGRGPLLLHVGGQASDAGEYRVGQGWSGGSRVDGSQRRSKTGSLGLTWLGEQATLGAAVTRQTARYGLPGHVHNDCHLHGLHLHCDDGHDHDKDGHAHHDHDDHDTAHGHVPVVDLRSTRYDLQGEWRNPLPGVAALRLRAGLTDYVHDEIDDGAVATTFRNRAHDWRLELAHEPLAGWRGTLGVSASQRRFSAVGEEAYVSPSTTCKLGVFWLEEQRFGDWGVQASLRHDRQRIALQADGHVAGDTRRHHSSSAAVGVDWRGLPGWRLSSTLSSVSRMPTAEELYARGMHMATNSYELGNARLKAERGQTIEFGVAKTEGAAQLSFKLYHRRMQNFIHTQTLVEQGGTQLLAYTQSAARFTGAEASVSHRFDEAWLGARWRATAWGDVVHARLAGGERIARLAPARAGLRLRAQWPQWRSELEWTGVRRQTKVAAFESVTPGHGLLNWRLSWEQASADGKPWQLQFAVNNVFNKLAYVHTSAIKWAAPLTGRSFSMQLSKAF